MVSWAKYGTSVQVLPSESTIDWIPIILESSNDKVLNLSALPIIKVDVLIQH